MPLSPLWPARKPSSCWRGIVALDDGVGDIGAVEAGGENPRLFEAQPLDDVLRGWRDRPWRSARCAARRGRARSMRARSRYSGRKSWPHWLTQWASSMANSAISMSGQHLAEAGRRHAARARHRAGRARHCAIGGERAADSSGVSEELSAAALTPAWRSASTWSRIRAISGETTMPTPGRQMAGIW